VSATRFLSKRSKPGVQVEHHALGLRPEKRLVRMLAVDVDEPISRLTHLVDRRGVAVMNARERPFASTTRRNSNRFGSPRARARATSPRFPGSESMANSAVTSARSAPERTCSPPVRSPSVIDNASIRIDFPAPVRLSGP